MGLVTKSVRFDSRQPRTGWRGRVTNGYHTDRYFFVVLLGTKEKVTREPSYYFDRTSFSPSYSFFLLKEKETISKGRDRFETKIILYRVMVS